MKKIILTVMILLCLSFVVNTNSAIAQIYDRGIYSNFIRTCT